MTEVPSKAASPMDAASADAPQEARLSVIHATGAIVPPEVACRCVGDCDRDGDADVPCRHCRMRIDPVYDPCPRLGFGCGMGADEDTTPCDCCTPEQWQAAASA